MHITKGDCDEASSAPEDEVLAIGDLRVGLCHGHQVGIFIGSGQDACGAQYRVIWWRKGAALQSTTLEPAWYM